MNTNKQYEAHSAIYAAMRRRGLVVYVYDHCITVFTKGCERLIGAFKTPELAYKSIFNKEYCND